MNRFPDRLYRYVQAQMKHRPFLSAFCLIVLALHLFLVVYSQIHPAPKLSPHRKKLLVKTMVLPPDPSKPMLTMQEKSLKNVAAAVKPLAHAPKKTAASAKTQKAIVKSPKTVATASAKKLAKATPLPSKTKQLLNDLQESIAKIETNRDNISPTNAISVPTPIKELKADTYEIRSESVAEEGIVYRDVLIHHLKDILHLPGYGTVKVELTLSHQGLVENLAVVYSDSEVNRLYLERALQELAFPPFVGELCNKKNYTFYLTFCSDH